MDRLLGLARAGQPDHAAWTPGEVFVHRNIANVVVHTDLNCLSVIQFAVDVLKVEHILVVGHYGCGGVHAALTGARVGLADNWLRHVGDVANKHAALLDEVDTRTLRHARLCELNVIEQVVNVCQTTIVQDAWARGQALSRARLGLHACSTAACATWAWTCDAPTSCSRRTTPRIAASATRGQARMSDAHPAPTPRRKPVGAYPHARRVGDLLFLSGIGPRDAGDQRDRRQRA